jgi:hypothetical protein
MNTNRLLALEFVIALGFSSWSAIKTQQLPWPPTVVKSALAFGVLAMVAVPAPEFAATLGGGFLLAQLMRALQKKPPYTGGAPTITDNGEGQLSGSNPVGILTFGKH